MIPRFSYSQPTTVTDADQQLSARNSVPLGGGTDLMVSIREDIERPDALVDLTRIPDARTISSQADGSVRIGGAVRLAHVVRNDVVRDRFPALVQACESVGTPALRTMGTIAGNLCQRPRCWYLRSGFACHKNGGDSCPAAAGENQYHAIFGGGPCYIVHPSDPAVALTALEAQVEVRGGGGPSGGASAPHVRLVPISEFFVLPS